MRVNCLLVLIILAFNVEVQSCSKTFSNLLCSAERVVIDDRHLYKTTVGAMLIVSSCSAGIFLVGKDQLVLPVYVTGGACLGSLVTYLAGQFCNKSSK